MSSVAKKNYWDKHWQDANFGIAEAHHPIRKWVESEIGEAKDNQSCLEIGCYPGKFLAVFGEKGYELNGVDMFKDTETLLPAWLKSQKYKVGDFYQEDFLRFETKNKFDVIGSFGFIEHFNNWPWVVKRQVELAKTGGIILVDVPNLKSPLYYLLYRVLEPSVLLSHEMSALNLKAIKKVFEANNCEIKSAGYTGYFYFRFVTKNDKWSKNLEWAINFLRPVFELWPESVFKRYITVVAIKK